MHAPLRDIEKPICAFRQRPGLKPRRVGNQLAQAALGQAETPREPHGRPGFAANDANLNFEAWRQLPPLDKGGVHHLSSCESTARRASWRRIR
jgi:hypothetical protein